MATTKENTILRASKLLKNAQYAIVFTGAGISVESGIPPFRGPTGLWSQYDPLILDINNFQRNSKESWITIKEIFYDFWETAKPNPAHNCLADLETKGIVKEIITQNIDNLHQKAGSTQVHEFHGTLKSLTCLTCFSTHKYHPSLIEQLPASCPKCQGLLKPDFIFFGEAIPETAKNHAIQAITKADVVLVVGTTGEVMPACQLPYLAKQNGASIIEINVEKSNYTNRISDVFIQGKAGEILPKILDCINYSQYRIN